jgi:hypothetical protein
MVANIKHEGRLQTVEAMAKALSSSQENSKQWAENRMKD